ncbi:MAG: hypothetical protein M3017_04815 [Actinomycetota bacterium]|nr:hypothetical protein [Actinomycetota bacterium]
MVIRNFSLHRGLPSAPRPAEAVSEPGPAETFGPFSLANLPLLIIAAVLVVLVIVAVFFIVAQLRRSKPARAGKVKSTGHRIQPADAGTGSLRQFRDALAQAQTSLAQGGTSGDGIVHCWLALERGAERAGFGGKPGGSTTDSTAEFLYGLHPNRGDVQTLLRLYHWASQGVTEDQRRISPAEVGAAKEALVALRLSIDVRLATAAKATTSGERQRSP